MTDQRASTRYRADIDGLRALAVLPIVAFHLGFYKISGGFVGVDIFFVISGYLIGKIIIRQIQSDNYSVAEFYLRRCRRLAPALAAVLIATSVVSSIFLLPLPLLDYGKSLISTTLFGSNIYFWKTAAYFGADSGSKPLLHTWSLAVEEQYYIVFPLLILLAKRLGRWGIQATVMLVALASLVLCVLIARTDPSSDFYLLPTRLWEFLLGVIAVETKAQFLTKRFWREALGGLGLALIIGSMLLYTPATVFPGIAALAPCCGAALLLIAGGHGSSISSSLLTLSPLKFFGLISYSLYLWHWPIIVLLKQAYPTDELDLKMKLGAFALSTLLAFASWRWIERPWRDPSVPARRIAGATVASVLVLLGMATVTLATHGLSGRFSKAENVEAAALNNDATNHFRYGTCFIGPQYTFKDFDKSQCLRTDPSKTNALLLGDSHAAHLWSGLNTSFPQLNVMEAADTGCRPFVVRSPNVAPRCEQLMSFMFNTYLPSHPPAWLILAGDWAAKDEPNLEVTLDRLHALGIHVVLAGPVPHYRVPLPLALVLAQQRHDRTLPDRLRWSDGAALDAAFHAIAVKHGDLYLSAYTALCSTGSCVVTDDKLSPVQFDRSHLTDAGSLIVAKAFPILQVLPQ